MAKMLNNCYYNKIKLLHELSSIVWFVEKHALKDAQEASDQECVKTLQDLSKNLDQHIDNLKKQLCK